MRDQKQQANEIPIRVCWIHSTQLWHYVDFGPIAPLWTQWFNAGGLTDPTVEAGEEPPEWAKEFHLLKQSLMTVSPQDAVNVVVPQLLDVMTSRLFIIEPLINVQQCVVINSNIGKCLLAAPPSAGTLPASSSSTNKVANNLNTNKGRAAQLSQPRAPIPALSTYGSPQPRE